jgi:hypothetical protein
MLQYNGSFSDFVVTLVGLGPQRLLMFIHKRIFDIFNQYSLELLFTAIKKFSKMPTKEKSKKNNLDKF